MNNKNYIIITALTFFLSLLIFAYQREYIIFNFTKKNISPASACQKKNINIHFWHQNKWIAEPVLFLFSDDQASNLQQIINRWLQINNEEKIFKKKTNLQSAAITFDNQELIISFDRVPWGKESCAYDKWMILEGLFKTIQEVTLPIKKVRLLVNQEPLQDPHLDFTNGWAIEGFFN